MITLLNTVITAVTVFNDQAHISRQSKLQLQPGQHVLAIDKLPSTLVEDSVRVSGQGMRVLSVDLDQYQPPAPPISERIRAEERLAALKGEDRQLTRRLDHLKLREDMILVLAQASSASLGQSLGKGVGNPQDIDNITGFVEQEMAALNRARDEALDKQRDLKNRIVQAEADLQVAMGVTATRPAQPAILITVEILEPGELELNVGYLVGNASWQLSYDIQISGDQLRLVYLAHVRQKSGEDWPALPITLSTARPSHIASLPKLKPLLISRRDANQPVSEDQSLKRAEQEMGTAYTKPLKFGATVAEQVALQAEGNIQEPVLQTLETSGAIHYCTQNSVAIASNNVSHKLIVTVIHLPVVLDYLTIPKLGEQVILRAKARNTSLQTLPAGKARLMYEGEYIGRVSLQPLLPDQDFTLPLAAENRITVQRRLLERTSQVASDTNSRQMVYHYQITVSNHLPQVASITVRDQLPLSTYDAINVELTSALPQPSDHDEQNVLKWVLTLASHQTEIIDFTFRVDHPSDMEIEGLP